MFNSSSTMPAEKASTVAIRAAESAAGVVARLVRTAGIAWRRVSTAVVAAVAAVVTVATVVVEVAAGGVR